MKINTTDNHIDHPDNVEQFDIWSETWQDMAVYGDRHVYVFVPSHVLTQVLWDTFGKISDLIEHATYTEYVFFDGSKLLYHHDTTSITILPKSDYFCTYTLQSVGI